MSAISKKVISQKKLTMNIAIIGYGRIGKQVAKKCIGAFNMKVIIYDPFIKDDVVAPGVVRYSDEKQVFKEADVVSIHVPMPPETRNHVDEKLLSLMKPSAYLVNTPLFFDKTVLFCGDIRCL